MKVNFDEMESGMAYTEKQRYNLVVAEAVEGFSRDKGTPYLKLKLKTDNGDDAYDHTLWLTPKALYRAQTWFKALGLPDSGEVEVEVERLAGIKVSALCVYEKYTGADGKEHAAVKWDAPEKIGPRGVLEKKAAGEGPAKKEDLIDRGNTDDVPF